MKTTASLSMKVALWLGLNLAVLIGAGALFVFTTYGVGWESLLASGAGDRVRALSRLIDAELHATPDQPIDALLARNQPAGVANLCLFLNDAATQVGGSAQTLPPTVREELQRTGPARRPRGEGAPEPEARERGARLDNRGVGFILRAGPPEAYWIGLRMPVWSPGADFPEPGTLLLRVDSLTGLLRLFSFAPWFYAVAAAFVISVLCWLPFVTGLRRDLLALTHATEQIAEGRLDTRVITSRRDELGTLGHSINRMAERLEQHAEGQKRFLGDVAHELGSPIGRLQFAVELLEQRAKPDLQKAVTDVREEVQQMAALVNELLAFTQAGLRPRDRVTSAVSLIDLVQAAATREDQTGRVRIDLPATCRVLADGPLLQRALANLVRNALRYGGPGPVVVSAQALNNQVVVCVHDEGPGVPDEALARLGEPFFRPESARTRETGGVGLGLAIVRSAVAACGGTVRFANRQPHGFTAEVTLPAG